MAKCFDFVGYIEPCNAVRKKPTGSAMIFTSNAGSGETFSGALTLSDNGLKVTQILAETNLSNIVTQYKSNGGNVFILSIDAQNPFAITIQGNTDNGRVMYHKTVHCSLFDAQDGKAEEFIQGMLHGKNAGGLLIERDATNYADIFGVYDSIKIDPASITRSEYENGGAWEFDLYCDEPVPNVISYFDDVNNAFSSLNA